MVSGLCIQPGSMKRPEVPFRSIPTSRWRAGAALTSDPHVSDWSPAFSQDGSEIVFARAHSNRAYSLGGSVWDAWDIYIMKSDGTHLRRITREKYYRLESACFSSDGKSVLYSAAAAGRGRLLSCIFEVNVMGNNAPTVPAEDRPQMGKYASWASWPNVAPNGQRVAFISDRKVPFRYDILIMDRDGGNQVSLGGYEKVSRYNQQPIFTPDGCQYLVFGQPAIR